MTHAPLTQTSSPVHTMSEHESATSVLVRVTFVNVTGESRVLIYNKNELNVLPP